MDKNQIQALIDAKIKGQGTNIDAGSVLPPILEGILELAGNAAGPDNTDMSERDKMKTRANLGLYGIAETKQSVSLDWDGDTTGLEPVGQFYPIATDFADSVASITDENDVTLSVKPENIINGEDCFLIIDDNGNPLAVISQKDGAEINVSGNVLTFDTGVYVVDTVRNIEYEKVTFSTILVPAEYLPLSTDIVADKESNEKVATPKAVYDYVGAIDAILAQIIGADDTRTKRRGDFYEEPIKSVIGNEEEQNNER